MDDTKKAAALSGLRSLLIFLGAYAAGKGYIGQALLDQLVPAILVVVTAIWGVADKLKK